MGDVNTQLGLLSTLAAYEAAERANLLFPGNRDQERKADNLHAALTSLCLACGFEPGGFHMRLTVMEFAHQRAAVTRRTLPNHCSEAGLS